MTYNTRIMYRRTFVTGLTATISLPFAGCASNSGTDSNSEGPSTGAEPANLLPPEGGGWQIESQQQWDATQLHENADSAVNARYSGPDGGSYRIVIVQWGDDPTDVGRDTAQSAIEGDVRSIVRVGSVTLFASSVSGTNLDSLIDRSDTFQKQN